jgi:hypothetical protein
MCGELHVKKECSQYTGSCEGRLHGRVPLGRDLQVQFRGLDR